MNIDLLFMLYVFNILVLLLLLISNIQEKLYKFDDLNINLFFILKFIYHKLSFIATTNEAKINIDSFDTELISDYDYFKVFIKDMYDKDFTDEIINNVDKYISIVSDLPTEESNDQNKVQELKYLYNNFFKTNEEKIFRGFKFFYADNKK